MERVPGERDGVDVGEGDRENFFDIFFGFDDEVCSPHGSFGENFSGSGRDARADDEERGRDAEVEGFGGREGVDSKLLREFGDEGARRIAEVPDLREPDSVRGGGHFAPEAKGHQSLELCVVRDSLLGFGLVKVHSTSLFEVFGKPVVSHVKI